MNTLKKDKEFQSIYNQGKKTFGYYSLIFFKKNSNNANNCGFVASKKIGNAVCRNRLKRLYREYYRKNEKFIKKSYDIIFVCKKIAGKNIKNIKYEDIEKDMVKIFKTSNLFML
ncbi:MAG: ribonuclease P protein component [Fusobacteriaceae bacterium]|jgi:ribonuclease P protein component|nr:ribonuclease P protein component [Fusobacteriaceae bacterium]